MDVAGRPQDTVSPPREDPGPTVSRRDTLELIGKTSLVALLASACRINPPITPVADPKRPNIVYIHSHDTGRYIEPYGYDVSTPNLQRFADEGTVFRQAFCASPTCSPSRAALLTGMTPGCNGMWGLAHEGSSLNDPSQHLVHALKAAGYSSALVGMQHLVSGSVERVKQLTGYDEVVRTKSWLARDVADAAAEHLGGSVWNSPPKQPFFLDVGFVETHVAPEVTPKGAYFFYDDGDPATAELPANLTDCPETRADMGDYEVAAGVLDEQIGRVLGALGRHGYAENTLVIVTTDHGLPLPGMKASHTDGGLGVMLMLRGPGGFTGGKVSNALVSQLDVFPTLCELLELPKPSWLQGKSLLPLVRGEATEINEAVFAEYETHAVADPVASVRTRDYKYIRRLDGNDEPRYANTDETRTRELWLREGWDLHLVAPEQLYNLRDDPSEKLNLAADPAYAGVLDEMRGLMVARMERYDNPLLRKYNVADAPPVKAPVAPRVAPFSTGASEFGFVHTD